MKTLAALYCGLLITVMTGNIWINAWASALGRRLRKVWYHIKKGDDNGLANNKHDLNQYRYMHVGYYKRRAGF